MRLGQPDVQRGHARLSAVAHQHQAGGQDQLRVSPVLPQDVEGQAADFPPGQEHAHQRHHAAGHGYTQICLCRPHGPGRFLMSHPGIGGNGHNFKEHEGGVQVVGEKHAHHAAERNQSKAGVAAHVFSVARKIILGQLACQRPHEAGQQRVQRPEKIHRKPKPQAQHRRENQEDFLSVPYPVKQPARQSQLRQGEQPQQQIPCRAALFPRQRTHRRTNERKQQHSYQHHSITPSESDARYVMIRPANSPAAIRIRHSTVREIFMHGPGSRGRVSPTASGCRKNAGNTTVKM